MGILGRIFSKPINPDKVIDFTTGALDRINFSNQERADYNLKLAEALAEYTQKTLDESSDKSITRRYIAVLFIAIYMAIVIGTIIMAAIDLELAKSVIDIADNYYLTTAFIMVLAFFYGGYYISGIVKQKK